MGKISVNATLLLRGRWKVKHDSHDNVNGKITVSPAFKSSPNAVCPPRNPLYRILPGSTGLNSGALSCPEWGKTALFRVGSSKPGREPDSLIKKKAGDFPSLPSLKLQI
jgi:hypothetical protein